MNESDRQAEMTNEQQRQTDKHPYRTPILKEHGHAKEVTLQTFFGTFSPASSD